MAKDKRKPIVELDAPGGKIKQYWASGFEAAKFYNVNPVIISQHLHGRAKHVAKHYFRFATPEEINIYASINQRIEEPVREEPQPANLVIEAPEAPVEMIGEKTTAPDQNGDDLTPFDRLIKKGKEKFK